jgi:hypothetical protein
MSSLTNHLAKTDQRIREQTRRIELYRNRVARRSKNPAMAEQADQLLPVVQSHLNDLQRYRKRLIHALQVEAFLSLQADNIPRRRPPIPRYMR